MGVVCGWLLGVLQDDLRGGGGARAGAAIGGSKADLGLGDGVARLRGACFAFGGERGIAPALHDAGGVVFGLPVADEIEIERGGHGFPFVWFVGWGFRLPWDVWGSLKTRLRAVAK